MRRRAFLAGAGAVLVPTRAVSQEYVHPQALSGDRFQMDGSEFLLADIMAPALYTLDDKTPDYFEPSRALLHSLLASGAFSVSDAAPETRWGARIVSVQTGDERSVQEILVEEGAARVAPRTDDTAFIDRLLALEVVAREERRGLWRHASYRPFDAQKAEAAVGGFHLVEGTVLKAAATRGRTYLNFGEDYKTDFTAGAASRFVRRWAGEGLDLSALTGARVRIRGQVDWINGPSIDLVHRKQVEVLGE